MLGCADLQRRHPLACGRHLRRRGVEVARTRLDLDDGGHLQAQHPVDAGGGWRPPHPPDPRRREVELGLEATSAELDEHIGEEVAAHVPAQPRDGVQDLAQPRPRVLVRGLGESTFEQGEQSLVGIARRPCANSPSSVGSEPSVADAPGPGVAAAGGLTSFSDRYPPSIKRSTSTATWPGSRLSRSASAPIGSACASSVPSTSRTAWRIGRAREYHVSSLGRSAMARSGVERSDDLTLDELG